MKERYYIYFNPRSGMHGKAHQILKSVSCEKWIKHDGVSPIGYGGFLDATDSRLGELKSALEAASIQYIQRMERSYSVNELAEYPLLLLLVKTRPTEQGGPFHGTEYDLSTACPICGSGAIQVSPLLVSARLIRSKSQFVQTLHGEVIVSRQIALALREARVDGIELRQVVSHVGREPLPWWQILVRESLPPMDNRSKGILVEQSCPACNRDGRFASSTRPLELVYNMDDRIFCNENMARRTFELFGKSAIARPFQNSSFAQPLIMISSSVLSILRPFSREVHLLPVRLEMEGTEKGTRIVV